jgi:hypothetical protein
LPHDPATEAILEIIHKLQMNMPHLDLRVKNGSYKVFHKFNDDLLQNRRKPDEEYDGPRRAKQKIRTFGTESPVTKILSFIARCVIKKGNIRKETKETVVMEGVNLVLEQGKMYLIL